MLQQINYELLAIVILVIVVISIIPIYITLSIWHNTKMTKINTDKIVRLLEDYRKQEIRDEESKEEWICEENLLKNKNGVQEFYKSIK